MTTTNPILWTVNSITEANRKAGYHWFDPDTMRCFGTRVLSEVYQGPGGVFFVTSDKQFDGSRGYTVRRFDPEGANIKTHGQLCGYTKAGATAAAKEAAGVCAQVTSEGHKPVTVLEQFVSDLRTHGSKGSDESHATKLIQYARLHHKAMERECNKGDQFDAEGEPKPYLANVRGEIISLAMNCGATSVLFSGDPRGCTVKLTFADGFTNDFAKEGYCVPTSLTTDD